MRSLIVVVTSLAFTTAFTAHAGVIGPEGWSPAGCGTMPQAPIIDSSSADAFNKSIGTINEWQKQLQTYHDCMVKEANADNAAISQAATAEQKRINEAIEKGKPGCYRRSAKSRAQLFSVLPSDGPARRNHARQSGLLDKKRSSYLTAGSALEPRIGVARWDRTVAPAT